MGTVTPALLFTARVSTGGASKALELVSASR